jgi:hypothetical protein
MAWLGGVPLGLVKGVRRYTLTRRGRGARASRCGMEFTGSLLPLILRTSPDMNDSFRQFAHGLKKRAEGG